MKKLILLLPLFLGLSFFSCENESGDADHDGTADTTEVKENLDESKSSGEMERMGNSEKKKE